MTNNSWLIDYKRLAVLVLPTFLRKPMLVRYVQVMISAVSTVHAQLTTYRDSIGYELSMTGQVCRLRALLNDSFDAVKRRITIVDVEGKSSATVVWRRDALRGLTIAMRNNGGGVAISCRDYEGVNSPAFDVVIPVEVSVDDRRLRALVNAHKLAGKQFTITKLI
ncbi:MAG: hypothetical protein RR513_05790 [Muribaculaceae bacterium]